MLGVEEIGTDEGIVLARLEGGDGEQLRRFFGRLSPETIYRRFFSPLARPEQAHPERLLDLDQHDRVALVGLEAGEIVGVARYFRDPGACSAEVAVVVADAWQGRGFGSRLLRELGETARGAGIHRFTITTQPDNRAAKELIRRFDPSVHFRFDDGLVRAEVAIPTSPPALSDGEKLRLLRAVEELAPLGEGGRRRLLPHLDEVTVAAGTEVELAGRPTRHYLVVARGSLAEIGPQGRARLGPGAARGLERLLARECSPTTLVAEEQAHLLVMSRAQARALRALQESVLS